MKVIAVGGKAFFHKDVLKTLGFKWYRDGKLWVVADSSYPNGTEAAFSLDAKLSGMNGVTWGIQDLPVDALFRPKARQGSASAELADADTLTAPHQPEAAPAPMPAVSSIERARAALRTQAQPTVQAAPEQDPLPELTAIKAKIAAMRLALDEIEAMARQMSGRVEL